MMRNTDSRHIRPLGEEHLRMFRRTLGEPAEDPNNIAIPKEAKRHVRVFLSKEPADFQSALKLPGRYGGRLATVGETIADESLLKRSIGEWMCVNPEGMPMKRGWYRIGKTDGSLEPVMEKEANKLEWYERVYVYKRAVDDGKKGIPITLSAARGPAQHKERVELIGGCGEAGDLGLEVYAAIAVR